MKELVGNLHLHTTASDGTGTHDEVAMAALRAGLDFIIYTDHNVWVDDMEGWYQPPGISRKLLRLMGQEVNDDNRDPEANHLLTYFVHQELQPVAANPQELIDTINQAGGICFLAHPLERPGYGAAKQIFPWVNWEVSGYAGIELWNSMTDAKWQLRDLSRGVLGAYLPNLVLRGPFPETLARWDQLLANGQKVVAIGSSDAHAWSFRVGPLRRTVFPYEHLFQAVNTHLLLPEPPAPAIDQVRRQVYQALSQGHCFVGYDRVASARGFTFTASSGSDHAIMGDGLIRQSQVKLRVFSPHPARLRLIKDGRLIHQTTGRILTWQTDQAGVYRVEAYRSFWGQLRGWVFTNPIYVRDE